MADMITRCPKCGTAFRISDALLKSAKGVVRCGSCLSVFNAREHMEVKLAPAAANSSSPAAATSSPAAKSPPKTPPSVAPVHVEEKIHHGEAAHEEEPADDDTNQDEDDDQNLRNWRISPTAERPSLFERSKESKEEDADPSDEDDEAWALELLKDDSDLNVRFKKVTETPAKSQSLTPPVKSSPASPAIPPSVAAFEFPETTPKTGTAMPKPEAATPEPRVATSEPKAATPKPGAATPAPVQPVAPSRNIAPTFAEPAPEAISEESDIEEITLAPPPAAEPAGQQDPVAASQVEKITGKRKPIRPKLEPKSVPLEDVIAALEPEPLEVAWQQPGAWKKRLLWPALALLALLCLLIQVAWLEFHRLNRIEPYRSVYAVACRLIGCELPEMEDRAQIQTSNLLVRSHPEVADALLVDVILQNNAPFEQTFPGLKLTFTDLQNQPVASRTLTPAEYLGGELAGRDKMPVRQPIHIGMEIADPGSAAVSYHITIVD